MSKLLFAVLFSILLVSCDGGTSSNTKKTEASNITTNDGTTITTDGTVVRVNPDGTPEIIEDPNGDATITQNPDGGFTVISSGGEATFSADGSIINQPNINP